MDDAAFSADEQMLFLDLFLCYDIDNYDECLLCYVISSILLYSILYIVYYPTARRKVSPARNHSF